MEIVIVIVLSVLILISLIYYLLNLFFKKVLKNDIKILAYFITALLILQFILGMLSNLFQTIPHYEPWIVFHKFGFISAHTANAIILLLSSILFIVNGRLNLESKLTSIIGLSGIIIAITGGVIYVDAGQINLYSFIMSIGFIIAFVSYSYFAFSTNSPDKTKK